MKKVFILSTFLHMFTFMSDNIDMAFASNSDLDLGLEFCNLSSLL